jgi:DNA-binding NtrC family response regulator
LFGEESEQGVTPGFLEQAQGGTLYLDDVAELDAAMQQSLYAALSSGQWVRINGATPLALDVRVIAATRYNLEQEVRGGRFRQDLYHLLNVVPVHVPALREHVEDVTELLQYAVNQLVDKEGLPYRSFTVAAQNRLRHYEWPGNIRELESLVRRLLILGLETDIELDELEAALNAAAMTATTALSAEFELPLRQAREQFERHYLEYHLRQAGGSVGKVAKLVGMERTHLYRKLRALGIDTRRLVREK